MIVYEDEHAREDGLRTLMKLVEHQKEETDLVTTALVSSIKSGFNHEPQQCLRTIAFVRALWRSTIFYLGYDRAHPFSL
jgi:hypothetical protein